MNAKILLKGPALKHITAGRYHSVVTTDSAVYTFGLNAGQLGHSKGEKHSLVSLYITIILRRRGGREQSGHVAVRAGSYSDYYYIIYFIE